MAQEASSLPSLALTPLDPTVALADPADWALPPLLPWPRAVLLPPLAFVALSSLLGRGGTFILFGSGLCGVVRWGSHQVAQGKGGNVPTYLGHVLIVILAVVVLLVILCIARTFSFVIDHGVRSLRSLSLRAHLRSTLEEEILEPGSKLCLRAWGGVWTTGVTHGYPPFFTSRTRLSRSSLTLPPSALIMIPGTPVMADLATPGQRTNIQTCPNNSVGVHRPSPSQIITAHQRRVGEQYNASRRENGCEYFT